ncbi:MAG: hypothetical protein FJW36_00115 [Acidobacteria bacterium]|nr:hypothetical protein [Acidobacteriota bacterium]
MRSDAYIDAARCRDFAQSSALEWLDTNGSGAYAMGTVAGVRTRRYHSLLNAGQPTHVWLNALEDILHLGGEAYELATHRYPGTVTPRGYQLLGEFRLAPYPSWLYRIDEATLIKEVMLIDGAPAVLVRYCCSEDAVLDLRPFLAGRPQHNLLRANPNLEWQHRSEPGHLHLHRHGTHLHIRSDAARFVEHPDWYLKFQYAVDRSRGLDFEEDLWTPGLLQFELKADTWAYLVCALDQDPGPLNPLDLLKAIEAKERRFPAPRNLWDRLSNAAEHFIFEQRGRKSVIAGYPWFTDWGRDTFISMPGLFLARKKLDEAERTIDNFLSLRRDGLIPNRITDDGSTPEYNSIDATLWLFIAVWQCLESGGSHERFQDRFFAPMRDMLRTIAHGTIYGIHRDPADGLLNAGLCDTQLTWMDARVNGRTITPRSGKAVEINALWYNALRLMTDWARERGEHQTENLFGGMANQAIDGFTRSFWNPQEGCLFDLLGDPSIRPNQLFALSLPFPLVIRSKGESILSVVERDLLTPNGLRTLSPRDPKYRGRFEGGPEQRDSAYHQGTVWPWLFGPYARAVNRVRGEQPELKNMLIQFVESQLDQGCLGQLAEVYDGDSPQREGGCPAQAWSAAEILWVAR